MIADICEIKNLKISKIPTKCSYSIVNDNFNSSSNNNNNTTPLKFTCGSFYLPKENKARPRGEDAHFICTQKNTIGVADGVGGWVAEGVDAGKYARELMANSVIALNHQIKGSIDPGRVLLSAYRKSCSRGSSTALIIALNDNNKLRYANLGDSGLIVFREKKLLYQSPIQQHSFNLPYQLGGGKGDTPNMANEEEIYVEEGDVVVAATDGLFDNVYPYEIEEILNRTKAGDFDAEKLAEKIVECALYNAVDQDYFSPFAKAAEMAGMKRIGGKYDDITVVVAKIESDMATSS